jgi:hypothetical protein
MATLVLLAGCSGGEGRPALTPATESSPSTTSTKTPGDASEPTQPDSEEQACRDRQQDVVVGSAYPMQKAIDDVMSSASRASSVGARRVAARAEIARSEVLERCDRVPPAMRPYLAAAHGVGRSLTQEELKAVMAPYASWAKATGQAPTARKLLRAERGCRIILRHVTASYRVWWRWTDSERVWWIELSFDSDLDRTLAASLDGEVRATGLTRSKVWTPQGYSTAGVLTWGGSSADDAVVRPGLTRKLVAPSAGPYVITARDGSFEVQRVAISVGVPGTQSWWCSLPVPERS